VPLEQVIDERDRDYDTGGGRREREARKALDKRGEKCGGQVCRTQKKLREAEKSAAVFEMQEVLVEEGIQTSVK